MPANSWPAVDGNTIALLVAERARFHRFITARTGDAAWADDVLQESLLRTINGRETLRRGESAVAWFYRVLRNAIVDHCRKRGSEKRRIEYLLADLEARGEDVDAPPTEREKAVCLCFRGLLPALKSRYAEVIRRVDLRSESKLAVARDLKISRATMDVLLHRARQALRKHLEIFCGSCSREHCLACRCKQSDTP